MEISNLMGNYIKSVNLLINKFFFSKFFYFFFPYLIDTGFAFSQEDAKD